MNHSSYEQEFAERGERVHIVPMHTSKYTILQGTENKPQKKKL